VKHKALTQTTCTLARDTTTTSISWCFYPAQPG